MRAACRVACRAGPLTVLLGEARVDVARERARLDLEVTHDLVLHVHARRGDGVAPHLLHPALDDRLRLIVRGVYVYAYAFVWLFRGL